MAQSNGDEGPDITPPQSDLQTAEELGRRVAIVTKQWVQGRRAAAEESSQQKQEVGTAAATAL